MWNGVWKLTVMVGVIGVGLFAVFQAQQGMNRVASLQTSYAENDESSYNSSDELTATSHDGEDSGPSIVIDQRVPSHSQQRRPRPESPTNDDRIDLVGRFNAGSASVKTAKGTSSHSIRQVASVDLDTTPRRGLSFRDQEEFTDSPDDSVEGNLEEATSLTDPEPLTTEVQEFPDDSNPDPQEMDKGDSGTAQRDRQKAKSAAAAKEESDEPETSFDPFSDDPPPAQEMDDQATTETEEPAASEPAADPGNDIENSAAEEQASPSSAPAFDFSDDTDFPRSRRALAGSEKDQKKSSDEEASVDDKDDADQVGQEEPEPSELNLLDEELKQNNKQNQPVPSEPAFEESPAEEAPPLNAPKAFDETDDEDPPAKKPATPPLKEPEFDESLELGTPESEPASDAPGFLSDDPVTDPPTAERGPVKKRLTLPGVPPEIEPEPTRERRPSRDMPQRQPEPESVTPSDLIGDGVAGDPSQRGVQQPRLTIEKVAQQQAILDQPLIYTIIVRNTGTVVAHNVVVEDRIPKGTELLGTSPRAELVGKRLVWNELVLKPNEEKKISIKVLPRQEGPIGSVARLYFATEVSAEIQVATPQLEFTMKAAQEVRLGQSTDLVFILKNVGTVDASNILVRDIVPDNLKNDEGADIECSIGKLAPNEVREIVLPVTAVTMGSGINRAVMTADSGIKKELEQTINVVGELLVLTRTGHNRVYVERPTVFTNNVRNDGNLRVANVRVAEVVPAGLEFDSASDGGRYDARQRAVVWTLGPLEPGDDRDLSVKYVPRTTGTLGGKVTATGATGSVASVNSTIEVVGRPELQMETVSATGVVSVGDRITSKMQLTNSGTAPARNVRLSLRLPPELRLVEVRGRNYEQQDNRLIFETIDELAPRSTVGFEIKLEPTQEADAKIQLEITADHLSKPHRRDETVQIVQDPLR